MSGKLILCALVVLFACANATDFGYARIFGGSGDPGITGQVWFAPVNSTTIRVYARITGITQGVSQLHGFHVHTYGDELDPTGAKAGPHYIGNGIAQHGCYPNLREEGDMGNWQVDANGNVDEYHDFDLLTLQGEFSIIGRGIIFHNATDDCAVMTSSGARLARGVIGIGNPDTFSSTALAGLTFTAPNTAFNNGNNGTSHAVCYLRGINGNTISGTVFLEVGTGGVLVTASVTGLTASTIHGIHIHQYGDISADNGTSVAGHFNPLNQPHGLPPNVSRHAGDLGNICTYDSTTGTAYYSYTSNLISLSGVATSNINVIGRAVVIHAGADNGDSVNYGARIAQCVIGIANPTTTRPTLTVTPSADVTCGFGPTTSTTPAPVTTASPTTTTTQGPTNGASTLSALIALVGCALFLLAL